MRICHFCDTSLEAAYFRNITRGLAAKGVEVVLVELGSGTPPTWLGEVPTARYFSLKADRRLDHPFAVVKLARLLRREKVDILHAHLFNAGFISVLTRSIQRTTLIALMRHHTSVVRMLGSRIHIAADKWMAERADRLITVSDTTRKYMQEVDGIRKDISVVYLGFDFDRYSPDQANRTRVRDEFGFTDDDLVIGYVAGFAQGKGHKQLIQAFSSIAGELPDAKLFLVGQGDTTESRNLAAELGVGGRVIFTGWRSDAAACLNAMDIFVQPSLSEAFSQVLIEAMGSGLPVIATDVGSAREVIESGENGLLVEADDPGSISRHLVELHRNIELRKTLARAARESVIERFTVEKMVNDQYHLYNQWLRDQNGI